MTFLEYYENVFAEEVENNGWIFLDLYRENDYRFSKLRDKIDDKHLYKKEGFGKENDEHVTLLYGQNDKDFVDIKDEIQNTQTFEIKFGNISKFESDDYDVVKVEIISKELENLHYKLKENFENKDEFPKYNPHATLAYVLPKSCDDLLGKCDLTNSKMLINKITFEDSKENKTIIKLRD